MKSEVDDSVVVSIPEQETTKQTISTFPENKQKQKLILQYRIICFVITYFAYASIHATRTAWSSSKQSVKQDLNESSNSFIGVVDTCFLLSYAISMKLIGSFSQGFSIKYLLGFGMIGASICLLSIQIVSRISVNKPIILSMMILNGVSQSTGWPAVVACMGNWFGTREKGLLMGIWATSGNFGNIIGYLIEDVIVNSLNLNWTFVLLIVGLFLLVIGTFIIFKLKSHPNKLGITLADLKEFDKDHLNLNYQEEEKDIQIELTGDKKNVQEERTQSFNSDVSEDQEKKNSYQINQNQINSEPIDQNTAKKHLIESTSNSEKKITYFNAWIRIPGLTIYALTMGGVKGTVYGIIFWLPIYLQDSGLKTQSALICSMNEIGTFIGGLLLGYLIDQFSKNRAGIISISVFLSSLVMIILNFIPEKVALWYFICVFFSGVFLGGPYTLLGGAIAIDLAQQPEAKGQKNVTALLAGIIEGFGSFIAAIMQIIIPLVGQQNIFILFATTTFFSCIFLLQKAKKEVSFNN